MDIHIYGLRIDVQIKEICRGDSVRNKIFVGLHHSLVNIRTAEISSVDEQILVAESFPGRSRTAYKTGYGHKRSTGIYIHNLIGHTCSKHILDTELERLCRSEHIYILAVVGQGKSHIRTGEGYSGELSDYMLELHCVGLEELTPRRHIVEEISHREIRAPRSRHLVGRQVLRVRKIHLTSHLVFLPTGLESDLGHSGNRRKSLTAETEGENVVQVFCRLKLRGGMPLKTQHGLVRRHPATVIYDLYESPAGILNHHRDLVCTGIHRILHQLLHYRRRSLHDLSCSYHVRYIAW